MMSFVHTIGRSVLCAKFGVCSKPPTVVNFLFRTSTDPHAKVIGGLSLGQSNENKCEEQHQDDKSHPIKDSLNSFCFFFIHII